MKVILTGITGNLGTEIARALGASGHSVIPVTRPEHDLLAPGEIELVGSADCIIHAAGIVHFRDAGNSNETMLKKVASLAKRLSTPLYYVSTAFVYKQSLDNNPNSYIADKLRAEAALAGSGVPHAMLRPGILTGSSATGEIQSFTGYYQVIRAFREAIKRAPADTKIRFPQLLGKSSMVPTDQVAAAVVAAAESHKLGDAYLTTPNPPTFHWALTESLKFFDLLPRVEFLDCSFEQFGKLDLRDEERWLYNFGVNFSPFWAIEYDFPASALTDNLITPEYIRKILTYAAAHQL